MKVLFRASAAFMASVRADLIRPHAFAAERVGFIAVKAAVGQDHLVLLARAYHPVADEDYLDDPSVGAMMGSEAIRKALATAFIGKFGMIHVHPHWHRGVPRFSRVDLREQANFVPDFFNVRPDLPHGAIVLSEDAARGRCWLARQASTDIIEFHTTGAVATVGTIRETP